MGTASFEGHFVLDGNKLVVAHAGMNAELRFGDSGSMSLGPSSHPFANAYFDHREEKIPEMGQGVSSFGSPSPHFRLCTSGAHLVHRTLYNATRCGAAV